MEAGGSHYVLLSAICVQKPRLAFQFAKEKLENELAAQEAVTYTVVRPTAFFKSLGGQVDTVKQGYPFVVFGDGKLSKCNPISEGDLAGLMVDSITQPALQNRIIPVGGPEVPMTPLRQAEVLFELLGAERPNILRLPIRLMDGVIRSTPTFPAMRPPTPSSPCFPPSHLSLSPPLSPSLSPPPSLPLTP